MFDQVPSVRMRRKKHRPVFIVEEFNSELEQHRFGTLGVKFNKQAIIELRRLLGEIELGEDEQWIFAFSKQLENWLNIRREVLTRLYEENNPTNGSDTDDQYEDDDDVE